MMLHDPDSSARILAILFSVFAQYHFLKLEPQYCSVLTHHNPLPGCLLFPAFIYCIPLFDRQIPILPVVISVAEEMQETHHRPAAWSNFSSVQSGAYKNEKGFYLREVAVKFI